eukprot:TRINITY_DN8538_c0_g1_i1.p1 TRINITY_DN8538_c0_g1~~TRINITY_DN8538_c0_g1_i1.p1  ORF type:complete len:604 (+),score=97.36 TRINITY_DN8538_c0_g1_i1:28-1812(+)
MKRMFGSRFLIRLLFVFSGVQLFRQCLAQPKTVREVTISTIDKAIKSADHVVVMFFSPSCQHCQALDPEYFAAAQVLKKADPPMKLIKCDATLEENKSLLSRFNVMGYPSIKMFSNKSTETWEDYAGPRYEAGIVRYLKKWPQDAAAVLKTAQELQESVQDAPMSAFGYFTGRESESAFRESFEEVASKMKYLLNFGVLEDVTLVKSLLTGEKRKSKWAKVAAPGIVIHEKNSVGSVDNFYQVPQETYENATLLQEWVKNNTIPKVVTLDMRDPITRDQLDVLFKSKITQVIGFDMIVEDQQTESDDDYEDENENEYEYEYDYDDEYEEEEEEQPQVKDKDSKAKKPEKATPTDQELLSQRIKQELEIQSMKSYKGNYQFIFGDMKSNADTIKFFGLFPNELPAYVIYDIGKDQKYLKPNAKVEDLNQIILDFESGKLKRHVKSQPIPEDVPDRVPKMVVAKNFDELVMNNENDVLLELFAPWCRNCKRFAPVYQHVAEHFKNDTDSNVYVAVMNVDENDIPDDRFAKIEKIPTVLFVRNDDRKICKFNEDMIDVKPEEIIEFVNSRGGENCKLNEDDDEDEEVTSGDTKKEEL